MFFLDRLGHGQGTRDAVAAKIGAISGARYGATDNGAVRDNADVDGAAPDKRPTRLQLTRFNPDRLLPRRLSLGIHPRTRPTLRGFTRRSLTFRLPSLNRGDLLLLAAGVVAFFVFTFLPGVVTPGSTAPRPAVPHSSSLTLPGPSQTAPPDTFPWIGSAAVPGSAKGTAASAPSAPAPRPGLPANFPPAAAPTRIVYPAAGFDVDIHPLSPSQDELDNQAIVPPITMDAYWVTNFGTPGIGSTNTTYILGHSWEGRDAPLNRLSSATPGDIFEATTTAGTIRYRVDSVDTYGKATLKDSGIWTAVPNRLVLISCYAEDLWGKNVVVVASPVLEP